MTICVGQKAYVRGSEEPYYITHIDWDRHTVRLHQRKGKKWLSDATWRQFSDISHITTEDDKYLEGDSFPNMPQPIDPGDVLVLWSGRKVGVTKRNPLTVAPLRWTTIAGGEHIYTVYPAEAFPIDRAQVMCRTMATATIYLDSLRAAP